MLMSTQLQSKFYPLLFIALLAGLLMLSACAPAAPATATPTTESPTNAGTMVTFGPLTVVLPPGVANGANGSEFPLVDDEDAAWWQKTPGHLQVMLGDYYVLQGKFHQPRIYVYPAQEYAELVPLAFESINRINNILGNPSAISVEELPRVPFFSAQAVFASNIEKISFQNGSGVRFVTEYAQDSAPVSNYELFYHFQGVTSDGAYYIIAILPVTAQVLAETSDPAAAVPPGGVAYPEFNDANADWAGYYVSVTDLLNATPADHFTPALGQLDALINSMVIASP
jgi:hypothetical protein